jgi:hypothetical protein
MKSSIYFSVCLVLLCSCSISSVKQSYSPSGNPSYEISCNNAAGSLGGCYQKAGEICKENGYSIISEHHDAPFASVIAECKK